MDIEGAKRLSSEIGPADKRLVARLLGPFARLRLDAYERASVASQTEGRGMIVEFQRRFTPLELFPEGFGGESGTFPTAFRPTVSIRCCSIWTRISK